MVTTSRAIPPGRGTPYNGYSAARPAILGLAKVLFLGLCQLSVAGAAPLKELLRIADDDDLPKDPDDPSLWLYMGIGAALVLLGGAFAGLTIALMGQDGIYLQVIATSGEGQEQKHAQNVYKLLLRGKHWVLVTLLLGNVIVNETLPIVLDRSLGGGWPAVLGSTVLIVIFGEIIPQSVCVRYGLQIGSFMAPFVLVLMYLLAPIAWPTAKLLDRMLGEDHGTVYKKSGLKTLVTLHKTLGTSPSDRLNQDEVTIISAVLDLKDKPVGDIMTPMDDVFTMASDTVLDEKTMDLILSAGYSRIPIHEPGNPSNFVGMLLVKILITYDPEDCKRVGDFSLATLPETRPETSCLDIVNFFQEGKSHMVLVSESPGEDYGAMGVVTLEDVIEELIGEEIIDESDVYIDVHKAIRRMAPAPKAWVHKNQHISDAGPPPPQQTEVNLVDVADENAPADENGRNYERLRKHISSPDERSNSPAAFATSPKTTFMMRRSSSAADGNLLPIAVRGTANDLREHLKHLGPSNLASRPKSTRYQSVKIKPGNAATASQRHSVSEEPYRDLPAPQGGEGEGLLHSAGKEASDGVQALQQGYGSIGTFKGPETTNKSVQVSLDGSSQQATSTQGQQGAQPSQGGVNVEPPGSSPGAFKRRTVRSGSITENIVDAGGVRKVVLETNSSSDPEDIEGAEDGLWPHGNNQSSSTTNILIGNGSGTLSQPTEPLEEEVKKRKRRRNRKGNAKGGSSAQDGE